MVGLIDSIVISELGVGIDFQEEVAKNITQVSNMSLQEREKILDKARRELPDKIKQKADLLVEDLFNDKRFYELAGLDYSKELPPKVLPAAIMTYFLKHREELGF